MLWMTNKRKYAKHVKNNACKRVSTDREAVEQLSSRGQPWWIENLSRIYRPYRKFLDGSRICREAFEIESRKCRWIEIALNSVEKSNPRVSIDSLAVERYREAVKMCKNSFSKKRKTQIWMQSNMPHNQRFKQHFKLSKTSFNKKWQAFKIQNTHTKQV